MRSLKEEELKRIYYEEDVLKGSICRLCVTKDLEEFKNKSDYACRSLYNIISICSCRKEGGENV